jgi:hypothetical protein
MRLGWTIAGCLWLFIGPASVFAQGVGQKVLVRVDTANIMSVDSVIDTARFGDVFTVEQVNGPWLKVKLSTFAVTPTSTCASLTTRWPILTPP